ncbi:hypothetical protein D9623_28465 (plasmid) [Azospirillum brasilense]|uniref:Uncharacterized protein n=1 Tax=Azospirillum brasilense TaxID=192 RepID=A0A4D8QNM4_AZOBR|nr:MULTISPECIES: hypothetical protein [Azospirillum]MDW7554595.1 hypothetical protein [Azospirillum brasilense]MDW7593886.1 hypothetical protein [Azospirillum brasilense]MDW7632325.1 hypothetical protein [Azospirillum brasilense]MDX5950144.1 hypothetical protein [Azospirillum brasilense]OPH13220.1 hypothetical protein FE89_23005 [Azospirillum brasilense]
MLDRLRRTWRLACGDTAEPSTVVIHSRTCRSLSWLSCCRRLNVIVERTKAHLIAFVEIAFVSIL